MSKRKVEVISASCPACEETVRLVKSLACEDCEITVLDAHDPAVMQKARDAGACCCSVPFVLVDGEPAPCCTERRGPDEAGLRAAGVGAA